MTGSCRFNTYFSLLEIRRKGETPAVESLKSFKKLGAGDFYGNKGTCGPG